MANRLWDNSKPWGTDYGNDMRRTLYRYALWDTARNLVKAFGVFAPWLLLFTVALWNKWLVGLGVDRPLALYLAAGFTVGCIVLLIGGFRVIPRLIFWLFAFVLFALWLFKVHWAGENLPHAFAVLNVSHAAAPHAAAAATLPHVTRFGRSIHWTS